MKAASVLVVDDEQINAEIIIRNFALKGHRGIAALDAEQAVAKLAAGTYDLVLLDHILPGITGMQALDRLKRLTQAPIYMMSGYSGEETRRDAVLLGAAGFFPKPLDIPAILAVLDALPERP
ncbi:MAG: response regulator [Elusimicrobia bacterium]|nr:response regulator [Elusimicrobiota bacterium]